MASATPPDDPQSADTSDTSPRWRVTLWAMVSVQLIMSLSFTILSPIMPLFLPQVGVTSIVELDLWSGGLAAVTSFIAAFAAPIWGRLSDKHGRKPMVLRASAAIGILTAVAAAPAWRRRAAALATRSRRWRAGYSSRGCHRDR